MIILFYARNIFQYKYFIRLNYTKYNLNNNKIISQSNFFILKIFGLILLILFK